MYCLLHKTGKLSNYQRPSTLESNCPIAKKPIYEAAIKAYEELTGKSDFYFKPDAYDFEGKLIRDYCAVHHKGSFLPKIKLLIHMVVAIDLISTLKEKDRIISLLYSNVDRKRLIKLLMGTGLTSDEAKIIAKDGVRNCGSYKKALICYIFNFRIEAGDYIIPNKYNLRYM